MLDYGYVVIRALCGNEVTNEINRMMELFHQVIPGGYWV